MKSRKTGQEHLVPSFYWFLAMRMLLKNLLFSTVLLCSGRESLCNVFLKFKSTAAQKLNGCRTLSPVIFP